MQWDSQIYQIPDNTPYFTYFTWLAPSSLVFRCTEVHSSFYLCPSQKVIRLDDAFATYVHRGTNRWEEWESRWLDYWQFLGGQCMENRQNSNFSFGNVAWYVLKSKTVVASWFWRYDPKTVLYPLPLGLGGRRSYLQNQVATAFFDFNTYHETCPKENFEFRQFFTNCRPKNCQ